MGKNYSVDRGKQCLTQWQTAAKSLISFLSKTLENGGDMTPLLMVRNGPNNTDMQLLDDLLRL